VSTRITTNAEGQQALQQLDKHLACAYAQHQDLLSLRPELLQLTLPLAGVTMRATEAQTRVQYWSLSGGQDSEVSSNEDIAAGLVLQQALDMLEVDGIIDPAEDEESVWRSAGGISEDMMNALYEDDGVFEDESVPSGEEEEQAEEDDMDEGSDRLSIRQRTSALLASRHSTRPGASVDHSSALASLQASINRHTTAAASGGRRLAGASPSAAAMDGLLIRQLTGHRGMESLLPGIADSLSSAPGTVGGKNTSIRPTATKSSTPSPAQAQSTAVAPLMKQLLQ
jgi:hypothetical protein